MQDNKKNPTDEKTKQNYDHKGLICNSNKFNLINFCHSHDHIE